jgi:hypothetical protein
MSSTTVSKPGMPRLVFYPPSWRKVSRRAPPQSALRDLTAQARRVIAAWCTNMRCRTTASSRRRAPLTQRDLLSRDRSGQTSIEASAPLLMLTRQVLIGHHTSTLIAAAVVGHLRGLRQSAKRRPHVAEPP